MLVVVTVTVRGVCAPPLPETVKLHVPTWSGVNVNGPEPVVGAAVTIPVQVVVLRRKPAVLPVCETAAVSFEAPVPAAKNASAPGLTTTAGTPLGAAVGAAVGVAVA